MLAKVVPIRSTRYLDWIRLQPCVIYAASRFYKTTWQHCDGAVEAAHTGSHGLGSKADDVRALPMCAAHHRTGKDSYHGLGREKLFEEAWAVDLKEQVIRHMVRFIQETGDDAGMVKFGTR